MLVLPVILRIIYVCLLFACARSCEVHKEAALGGSEGLCSSSQDSEDGHGVHLPADRGAHNRLEVHQEHTHQRQLHPHNLELLH